MSLDGHLSRTGVTAGLKQPTRSGRAALCSLFGLASNGVYICPACYQSGGSLLHCLSTLTQLTLCGLFLLHYPWSRLRQTLSGILPCEARTFLSRSLSASAAATICLTQTVLSNLRALYHEILFLSRQAQKKRTYAIIRTRPRPNVRKLYSMVDRTM